MSAQTLERDLEEFLANTGYEVRFHLFASETPCSRVFYDGQLIAEHWRDNSRRSWKKVAQQARKTILDHQEATRIVGGLLRGPK